MILNEEMGMGNVLLMRHTIEDVKEVMREQGLLPTETVVESPEKADFPYSVGDILDLNSDVSYQIFSIAGDEVAIQDISRVNNPIHHYIKKVGNGQHYTAQKANRHNTPKTTLTAKPQKGYPSIVKFPELFLHCRYFAVSVGMGELAVAHLFVERNLLCTLGESHAHNFCLANIDLKPKPLRTVFGKMFALAQR